MFCLVLWLTMCQQFSFSRARATKCSFFLFLHAMGLNKFGQGLTSSKTTLQNSYFYERNVLPPQSLSGGGNNRIQNNCQIVFQVIRALGKVGSPFFLCVWYSPQCLCGTTQGLKGRMSWGDQARHSEKSWVMPGVTPQQQVQGPFQGNRSKDRSSSVGLATQDMWTQTPSITLPRYPNTSALRSTR